MASHNNRIIIFFSIFDVLKIVPFVFLDGKLAIKFATELARLCYCAIA